MNAAALPGIHPTKTGRSLRREFDRYLTPASAVHSLLATFPEIGGKSCLEACSGNGVLPSILSLRFSEVITNDLDRKIGATYALDARKACLYEAIRSDGKLPEWMITNPPYSVWSDIAHQALSQTLDLALLLRVTALEATKKRVWLMGRAPSALLVMPRIKFKGPVGSDNCCYVWAVWSARVPRGIFYPPTDPRQTSLFFPSGVH